jgi:hypothetical protein
MRTWEPWTDLFSALVAAAVVWLVGMVAASRGTVLHSAFWSEYMEGLHNQAFSGLGLLPIADVPAGGMAVFAGMLAIYFFAIGIAGSRVWLKAGAEIDLFLGSISAYGLGLLLLFVGRSHPSNLFHPMMPLAVVIVSLLSQFRTTVARSAQPSSLGWIIAIASLAFLWSKPEFLAYPSLLKSALTAPAERDDVSRASVSIDGIKWTLRNYLDNMREVAHAMKQLPVGDEDVAVLDDWDTLLDFFGDRAPWSRYTSLFHGLLTKEMVAQTQQELLQRRPRFIVIRSAPPPIWEFKDIWTSFHQFVPQHYRLVMTIGAYEFWRSTESWRETAISNGRDLQIGEADQKSPAK